MSSSKIDLGSPSIVIRNSLVVDGTGRQAYSADVAVTGDRITAVGTVSANGVAEIDAEGKVLAPGFIDVHTHYDPQLCWDKLATPTPEHGVTSLIMGNCSVGLAPVAPDAHEQVVGWFTSVEDMDADLLRGNIRFNWESVGEYLAKLRPGLGPNVGVFVGHAVIRAYVMGAASQQRVATDEEIQRMVEVLRDSLEAGAFGLSFTYNHLDHHGQELPCYYADRREIFALLHEVARADRMVEVSPDFRQEGRALHAYDLFGELSIETGARVTLSPLLIIRGSSWRERLDRLEMWRAKGAKVFAQTQVRPLDMTIDLSKGALLFGKTPLWRSIMDQSVKGKIALLSDPGNRDAINAETDEIAAAVRNLFVRTTFSDRNTVYRGRSLKEIAKSEGRRLGDVLVDIVLADEIRTEFTLTGLVHADAVEVGALLKHPAIHIGSADAGAHITAFSGAGDTCYLFEKFVRAENLLSLEHAVKRLTSDIARDWGLTDRGEIAVGRFADLVLFDPATIAREPEEWVNDLPGGGGRYVRKARGISKVIVNGEIVVAEGEYTQARPGQLL